MKQRALVVVEAMQGVGSQAVEAAGRAASRRAYQALVTVHVLYW